MKKMYCLVVTDDYSRFSWVLFLATKDKTSGILKSFITGVENLIDQRVKVIRYDNGTEFKNKEMNQFYERKGIKREFSVARTPQQNRVAERKNRTLIEAARIMLADSKLPTTFWAEAVNTACYVQNRVLVTKPHNKTPYELFLGRKPALGFMRPFGCPVTILNTIDHLGKFDGKADEGFFVGYSINSKAFRVFNSRTRIVEENLHVQFSENTPNIAGSGPNWLFDIDALTKSMNYKPVVAGNQSNGNAGTKACDDAGKARMETVPGKDYILLPLWTADPPFSQSSKSSPDAGFKPSGDDEKKVTEEPGKEGGDSSKDSECKVNAVGAKTSIELLNDPNMPELEDIVYSNHDEDVGAEADINNFNTFMPVSPIPTSRIHKDHPVEQIIIDLNLAPQTRRMSMNLKNIDFSWIYQIAKKTIGTKGFTRTRRIERGIVIKKQRQDWCSRVTDERRDCMMKSLPMFLELKQIRYFSTMAHLKTSWCTRWMSRRGVLFFTGKIEVKSMLSTPDLKIQDVPDRVIQIIEKRLFLRGKINKTLFIRRDKGDILLVQVYVDDIIFGSTKKSLCTEFEKMMHKKFQMSSMCELIFFLGLQVKQKEDGIFISQDKYVTEILKKFGFTDVKTASTPMETQKPLLKDEDGEEVDVHLYRSMIGSLMYLTSSRPDIMFAVCACARYQVNPKVSHLHAVKRIYSDYAGASLDRKSTTGGEVNAARLKLTTAVISSIKICFKPYFPLYILHLLKQCIEQFWATVKVKTVNGEQQLQALVDGKKIVVTEASVRRDLQLDDEEGTDCLPNATIFEELTRMGYEKLSQKLTFYKAFFSPQWKFLIHTILQCLSAKTTAWNEFSSTMASAIICLATNQKFNFSKYIFESMVKNLDNAGKFLMYPRFIQVFLDNQLEGMSSHKRIYVTPSHTKKIFANMRRQGKDFSGRETPLFPTMVVQAQEEMGEGSANLTDPHHTPIITQPSSSQPQKKHKSRRPKEKDTQVPQLNVADEDSMTLKELMDFCTKLQQRVLDLENTKTAQAQEITSLKKRVKKLEKKGRSRTRKLKRLYKVGRSARIVSSDEASLGDQENAFKHGRKIDDIDRDTEITLVDETQGRHDDDIMFDVSDLAVSTASTIPVSAAIITEDEITLAQALAKLKSKDKGKGIMVEEPLKMKKKDQISLDEQEAIRLQAEFDEEVRLAREKDEANVALIEEWNDIQEKINVDFQLAQRLQSQEQEELTIEERAKLEFKRAGEDLQQESTKKQKIDDVKEIDEVDEDKETAELQSLMKVIPNEEEVAVDVIPLATKPLSIVEFKILKEGKPSYFQIIRVDRSSKRYTRSEEDYEKVLWGNLKTMFEPHVEDLVWRNLQGNKVLIWKLFDSYGVHFVRFQNMHIFISVEKRYPLTPATITEMLIKKLQADH
ncbi:putative ribonuclease H-like domain-containing protein [Tanacetum coccineum]|uniref:Ribonuclease H-like domain-containing protein n=1 Tax=Tanacetum coccineum TaxID=301880 RepID=A0ABQ5DLT7_9ASTR